MRCKRCRRANLRQKVNVFVDAPFPRPSLHKAGLRSREVQVDGVGWDRALVYCPKCGWSMRYDTRDADATGALVKRLVKLLREASEARSYRGNWEDKVIAAMDLAERLHVSTPKRGRRS